MVYNVERTRNPNFFLLGELVEPLFELITVSKELELGT